MIWVPLIYFPLKGNLGTIYALIFVSNWIIDMKFITLPSIIQLNWFHDFLTAQYQEQQNYWSNQQQQQQWGDPNQFQQESVDQQQSYYGSNAQIEVGDLNF